MKRKCCVTSSGATWIENEFNEMVTATIALITTTRDNKVLRKYVVCLLICVCLFVKKKYILYDNNKKR